MGETILPNARIDEHPLGNPKKGDYLIFRDMENGKTKKCLVDQFLIDIGNFEWTSTAAEAGDYDEDDVVTYSGNWYQSTIDNNESRPGVNADWTLLTRSFSWQYWVAGVYVDEDVFVLREVGTVTHIFKLADASRPYVSADFTTEFAAGDWELLGKVELVEVDTAGGNINLDLRNLTELAFKGSNVIAGNKNVFMLNDGHANEIRFFRFSTDAAGRALTFEADVKHQDWDGNWTAALVWSSPAAGSYDLIATCVAGEWHVRIYGVF